ncbi:helix-turn-helix transcriptional regulator [Microbacterium sp. SA39]|uniref:helix-turn-helix transcriptional regulator n=1 Tax=Microbacterium sp. SA39 TaxID=1263625 RepID=UPI0005FA094C|nr:AraC family transcriptional regulator [Microbacterium sp. SA39]KJQ55821.1 transcriptional regulator EutR [Microbacterium sp. SA39]
MQFTSRNVDDVESTWQQYVPSAALQKVDPQRFRFDWRAAELGTATLVHYDLAAQVHSTAEPHDQLLVCRVDSPDVRLWSDRQNLDARLPWLTDGTRVQAQWNRSARVRALVFDRDAAQERARQFTGDDDVELRATGLAPRTTAAATQWERMFRYLDDSLGGESSDDRLLLAEFERHALLTTLSTFSTTLAEAMTRSPQRSSAPLTVRRALSFIEENAHLPITIDDVARASFISTRGLQYAFRRALDITPTEALRQARLDGARREIERGEAASIRAIARRWGFSHPSRFIAAYRAAHGVAPSASIEPLRRGTTGEEYVRV